MRGIKIAPLAAAVILAAMLTACAGGGREQDTSAAPETSTSAATTTGPTTTEAATTTQATTGGEAHGEIYARALALILDTAYEGRLPDAPEGFDISAAQALELMAPYLEQNYGERGADAMVSARMFADTGDSEHFGGKWGLRIGLMWDVQGEQDDSATPFGRESDNFGVDSLYCDGRTGEVTAGPSGPGRIGYTNQDRAAAALALGDLADMEALRWFFMDYFGQTYPLLQFLPEFDADTPPNWTGITMLAYTMSHTVDGDMAREQLDEVMARYFPEVEYEHKSSGMLTLGDDGVYRPTGWDYGGASFMYLDAITPIANGRYRVTLRRCEVDEGELVDASSGETEYLSPNMRAIYDYAEQSGRDNLLIAGAQLVLGDPESLEPSSVYSIELELKSAGGDAWISFYAVEVEEA